jgi:hypothetical protein
MSYEGEMLIKLTLLMVGVIGLSGLLGDMCIKLAHKLGFQFEQAEYINTDFINRMENGEVLHADNMFKKN